MTYEINYTIEDDKGRKGRFKLHMANAQDYGEVVAYAQDIAQKIEPLHLGALRSISITRSIPLPSGLRATPQPAADVEEKMAISYRTEFNHTYTFSIPAFNPAFAAALFGSKERILDLLEPEPTALNNLIVNAPLEGYTEGPTDKREETLTVIKRTRQRYYSSTRGRF